MLPYFLRKFIRNPFLTTRNAIYKVFIAPLRYRRGRGYDAEGYWRDRLSKYGMSLQGVGDEGLSEEENRREYEAAADAFRALCREEGLNLQEAAVGEIGVGTGFYADVLAGAGVKSYVGTDITEVLFAGLKEKHPTFTFLRRDITAEAMDGEYDLVVMMDVVEHIVEEEKLEAAMRHVRGAIKQGGVFILSGVREETRRFLFHYHGWSAGDILKHFPGCAHKGPMRYRNNYVLVIRRA